MEGGSWHTKPLPPPAYGDQAGEDTARGRDQRKAKGTTSGAKVSFSRGGMHNTGRGHLGLGHGCPVLRMDTNEFLAYSHQQSPSQEISQMEISEL